MDELASTLSSVTLTDGGPPPSLPKLPKTTSHEEVAPSYLRLSVTRTWGNRTLKTNSPEWRALRTAILLRDKNTCASCGYTSPHAAGRGLKVDHSDGNASNNDPSNLRVHCPPCEAIRHCGFHGMREQIVVAVSDMEQVEIVRKTRELFEKNGRIPPVSVVDPHAKKTDIDVVDLANTLLDWDWEDLGDEEKSLRGFFTPRATYHFTITMKDPLPSTEIEAANAYDAQAAKILSIEESLPWVRFSPEADSNLQAYLTAWPPSTTPQSQVAWICISNPHSTSLDDENDDVPGLLKAWDELCAERKPTTEDLDSLARKHGTISGKWLVFPDPANVDALWFKIARATRGGSLGPFAKVSPKNDENTHVICVFTKDYTDEADVRRVRDGLQRLGVKKSISYKPDVYTYCKVYKGNAWGIRPSRYYQ